MRDACAAEPREPLRAAVTRDDASFTSGLAELGGLAGQANRAGERKFATAAEGEAVDRANGRLPSVSRRWKTLWPNSEKSCHRPECAGPAR